MSVYDRIPGVKDTKRIKVGGKVMSLEDRRHPMHAVVVDSKVGYYKQTFPDAPISHLKGTAGWYRPVIRRSGEVPTLKHASLQCVLTLGSTIQLAPMPLWWDTVQIPTSSSTEPIWSMSGEQLYLTTMFHLRSATR